MNTPPSHLAEPRFPGTFFQGDLFSINTLIFPLPFSPSSFFPYPILSHSPTLPTLPTFPTPIPLSLIPLSPTLPTSIPLFPPPSYSPLSHFLPLSFSLFPSAKPLSNMEKKSIKQGNHKVLASSAVFPSQHVNSWLHYIHISTCQHSWIALYSRLTFLCHSYQVSEIIMCKFSHLQV